ncbi:MAG: TraB/GumN family protein [Deltaproteobacteria bacterium]|nr:TraB/GumN family protein [Deltaproteobacteria bacterium]
MGIIGIVKQKRVQWFIVFLFICFTSLWTSINLAQAQAGLQKKNFLWSVKKDNTTIYLLGSIHFLKSDSYPLDKNIETAYRDCKTVVFETDISAMDAPSVQEQMMALALYPEGQLLQQNISPETYSMLEKKVNEAGLPMEQFNRMRPWMCALTLDGIELMKMGFDPQYGVDRYFFEKAEKDGKEKLFLETLEFQIKLLVELNGEDEDAFLRQTLEELEVIKTLLPDMVKAWETGDAARVESIGTLSLQDYPEIYDRLFTQRNKAWVSTIERLIGQGGNAFVVVGAGHLVGPDNLLQLLKDRGYTIEQIPAYTGVAAVSTENLVHALYIRSGMEGQIRSLPVAINLGFDQGRKKDEHLQKVSEDFYADIKALIVESFASEHLNAIVLRHMGAQLRQDEMEKILAWLKTPFGGRCSDIFKASLTLKAPVDFQEFLVAIQKSPPPTARLELIQELASATKSTETALETAVATQLVVTTALNTTLDPLLQKPFSHLFNEVDKNRPLLEPEVEQQITVLLLYLCRSFSDAELEQYIAFARSGIGTQYYSSMLNGIRLALMDSGIRFGSAMTDLQWRRKQGFRTLSEIERVRKGV